jgi:glycosyltransferase involved in cell wall biosynthesis
MSGVSVVIPAFNEEKTISQIVATCSESKYVDEVIVVDDGSIDNTSEFALHAGAKVIREETNKGKAYALYRGSCEAKGEILLFLDADLIGLNSSHVDSLIKPVISGEVQSTVGIFVGGRFQTDLAHAITPFLSGQRCIGKELFLSSICSYDGLRYGIEVVLSKYLAKNDLKVLKVPLHNVTHLMKEEKTGKGKGILERVKMYLNIFLALFKK